MRVVAAFIFLIITAGFVVLLLEAHGKIRLGFLLGPCGFKQRYNYPCPSCGMTHSAVEFVKGNFYRSFYLQPAGFLLCLVFVISAFFSFIAAVFGIYCSFLRYVFKQSNIKYIVLAVTIILVAGWAVTLARAFVENRTG